MKSCLASAGLGDFLAARRSLSGHGITVPARTTTGHHVLRLASRRPRGHPGFVKLISWNLLRLTGASLSEVVDLVEREQPDVLLMQEATHDIDPLPGGSVVATPACRCRGGCMGWRFGCRARCRTGRW